MSSKNHIQLAVRKTWYNNKAKDVTSKWLVKVLEKFIVVPHNHSDRQHACKDSKGVSYKCPFIHKVSKNPTVE